jgi:hypothetical protein
MRIEVTTTRMKLCGFVRMDQSSVCIHLWFSQKDPWSVSSSMHTINQSQKFSISIQTSKLEIRCEFLTALCTQANEHKMKIAKKQLRIGCAVIKRIKHLLGENQTNGCDQTTSEPSFGERSD